MIKKTYRLGLSSLMGLSFFISSNALADYPAVVCPDPVNVKATYDDNSRSCSFSSSSGGSPSLWNATGTFGVSDPSQCTNAGLQLVAVYSDGTAKCRYHSPNFGESDIDLINTTNPFYCRSDYANPPQQCPKGATIDPWSETCVLFDYRGGWCIPHAKH